MGKLFETIGSMIPDNLIAGNEYPILTKGVILQKSQGLLKRGSVLGIVTETGLAKLVVGTSTDGSQIARYILTDDVDTGTEATEDTPATVYETGIFNANALIFGGNDTAEDHEDELRDVGIFLRKNIAF
jgi:hypothetical protein